MGKAIAVAGAGVIAPVGIGVEAFRSALVQGQCAWGEVGRFRLADHISSIKTYIDRTSAFALAGCAGALGEAGWDPKSDGGPSVGLYLGTAWGCLSSAKLFFDKWQGAGARLAPPLIFPHAYANAPNSLASIEFGLRGSNLCISSGATSSALAIGHAMDALRAGQARRMLAGGAESLNAELTAAATGEPLSEGTGVLAMAADASNDNPVVGRLLGWGSAHADSSWAAIEASAAAALDDADLRRDAIHGVLYQLASGNEGPDAREEALTRLFVRNRAPLELIDLRSRIGDAMGSAGALGTVAAMLLSKKPTLVLCQDRGGSVVSIVAAGGRGVPR